METGSGPNFSGLVPGVNSLGDQTENATPWFKRWYVWVLPLGVIIGAIVAQR